MPVVVKPTSPPADPSRKFPLVIALVTAPVAKEAVIVLPAPRFPARPPAWPLPALEMVAETSPRA